VLRNRLLLWTASIGFELLELTFSVRAPRRGEVCLIRMLVMSW
jgi:hypothetical protein